MNVLEYPMISQCPSFSENYDRYPQWKPMNFADLLGGVSRDAQDLAYRLLAMEPTKRISVREAL